MIKVTSNEIFKMLLITRHKLLTQNIKLEKSGTSDITIYLLGLHLNSFGRPKFTTEPNPPYCFILAHRNFTSFSQPL